MIKVSNGYLLVWPLFFVEAAITTVKDLETISEGNFGEILNNLGGFLVIIFIFALFNYFKLKTSINENGFYYQYLPFHFSSRFITWDAIAKCYIRNYKALFEYGGWGLKFSFRKYIWKSFTVKGNIGLQLELTDGKKILIGTQKRKKFKGRLTPIKRKSEW